MTKIVLKVRENVEKEYAELIEREGESDAEVLTRRVPEESPSEPSQRRNLRV